MSEPGSRPKIIWIVALAGMLLVPIGGLVWAAVGHGGGGATDETIEAEPEDGGDSDEATTSKSPKKKKKKKSSTSSGPASKRTSTVRPKRQANHDGAPCCEALRKAGNEDPEISARPTYLAAASACESAPTAKRALTAVRSIVEGSRHELPSDCKDE